MSVHGYNDLKLLKEVMWVEKKKVMIECLQEKNKIDRVTGWYFVFDEFLFMDRIPKYKKRTILHITNISFITATYDIIPEKSAQKGTNKILRTFLLLPVLLIISVVFITFLTLEPSSSDGLADLSYSMGLVYYDADESKRAETCFRHAADRGSAPAQDKLGEMYERGQGVSQNRKIALALYNTSAVSDPSEDNPAIEKRKNISKKMTQREIEEGQALSRKMIKPGSLLKALDASIGQMVK